MDSTGSGSARSESYGQHRPPYEAELRGSSRMDSTGSGSARSESYGQHRPPPYEDENGGAGCAVEDAVPEDLVHSIVKFYCEALPCDLREPISRDEGLHTGVVRNIGGTVQNKEPEDKEPEAGGHT